MPAAKTQGHIACNWPRNRDFQSATGGTCCGEPAGRAGIPACQCKLTGKMPVALIAKMTVLQPPKLNVSAILTILRLQQLNGVAQFRGPFVEFFGDRGFHFTLHDFQFRERTFRFHFL
jgi:hypothetical protein